MQINQSADSPKHHDSVISLKNLTAGAIWEARSFTLDRSAGMNFLVGEVRPDDLGTVGIAAYVITFSEGSLSRRLLAIYKVADEWMLFDGKNERALKSVLVAWTPGIKIFPGFISLATLQLRFNGVDTIIKYFRPSLRHWFEGGWSMEDIDIGHQIACLSKNPSGLIRLESALKMGIVAKN